MTFDTRSTARALGFAVDCVHCMCLSLQPELFIAEIIFFNWVHGLTDFPGWLKAHLWGCRVYRMFLTFGQMSSHLRPEILWPWKQGDTLKPSRWHLVLNSLVNQMNGKQTQWIMWLVHSKEHTSFQWAKFTKVFLKAFNFHVHHYPKALTYINTMKSY